MAVKKVSARKLGCLGLCLALVATAAFPFLWRSAVKRYYQGEIYSLHNAPQREVAVVFGAAVRPPGRLSTVLRDRMDTAIELYHSGAVTRLLLTGGEQPGRYSEPAAMFDYAVAQGVPSERILLDSGGSRTYASCYRAQAEFGLDEAILVTQAFHLPRAIFTCDRLGLEAVGVAADRRPYRAADWYEFRETAATVVALWDVVRRDSPPAIGRIVIGGR